MSGIDPFLEAAVRAATPLLIASIGETVSERAGVINIGLEGCIIAGAYAAFVAASPSAFGGYGAAMAGGMAIGALLVIFAVVLERDQVIVGTALTMLALGLTGTLFRARADAAALVVTMEPVTVVPVLSSIPIVGRALFAQPAITYFALALAPLLWWWLYRTHAGLALRAVGDAPESARVVGVRVRAVQAVQCSSAPRSAASPAERSCWPRPDRSRRECRRAEAFSRLRSSPSDGGGRSES